MNNTNIPQSLHILKISQTSAKYTCCITHNYASVIVVLSITLVLTFGLFTVDAVTITDRSVKTVESFNIAWSTRIKMYKSC